MNETVQNLVQAIRAGDALETENAFTMAMQEKLSAKLDDMRQSVAQSMFTQETELDEGFKTEINEYNLPETLEEFLNLKLH